MPTAWSAATSSTTTASSSPGVAAADDQVGAVTLGGPEEGIAAQGQAGMGLGHGLQGFGDNAFARAVDADIARQDHRPALQPPAHVLQHAAHHLGHAGHDEDVADLEPWRAGDRVAHQAAAHGDPRHAPPRGRQLALPALGHHGQDLGMLVKLDAEGRGDAVGGDVVMGRADAAGGQHIVVAGAKGVQRVDDLGLDVADHPRLGQVDPVGGEVFGDVVQVGVLGAAGQDLVADDVASRGDAAAARSGVAFMPILPRRLFSGFRVGLACNSRNRWRAALVGTCGRSSTYIDASNDAIFVPMIGDPACARRSPSMTT